MHDIVLAPGLGTAQGVQTVFAGELKAFRPHQNCSTARQDCRKNGVLLYCKSYDLDDGAYKEIARAGGAAVFAFADLLCEKGFRRAITISKMRLAIGACRRMGCGFVFATLASKSIQLRTDKELEAFMAVAGLGGEEMKHSQKILAKAVQI